MDVIWSTQAAKDLAFFKSSDPKIYRRIKQLLGSVQATPFSGIGSPEPLRYELSGYWSRRINREHRLVYKVTDDTITIAQCRYHYT